MKKKFTAPLLAMFGAALLLASCTEENLNNGDDRFPDGLPIRLAVSDYNNLNTYYLLNDDEPAETFFDPGQRSFYVDQPLQMTLDQDLFFQIRFYSPRALPDVTVWAKIEGYGEEFKLFVFEKIMPFQQFRMQLPFLTEDIMAVTRSGKSIQIMANPHLSPEALTLTLECDAPYYKTLQSIKSHCRIRFQNFSQVSTATYGKYPLRVYQARESAAIALNMFSMFSSPEFEAALKAWGPLYSDNNQTLVDKEKLLTQALGHGELKFGNVGTGVLGLGGGGIFCLCAEIFWWHYADDKSDTETIFHEYAHCIGYSHSGNMTYGGSTGWTALCDSMYVRMSLDKKLPVYSRRFMNTRRTAKNQYNLESNYYQTSKHVIEDPELDEIDGGLDRRTDFLETDFGEAENAPALSFKLDYATAGVDAKNYMPRSVSVYGDKMYVANDIRQANWTWEVYDLSSGKPVLEKRFTEWTNPANGNTIQIGKPDDILRSRDKIYLAGSNNCLFVFDAATYECTAMLSLGGFNAVGMAATDGVLYAYRGNVRAFPEHDLSHGYMATSDNFGAHSENSMTADYAGNVYAVDYHAKRMIRVDSKYLMASKLVAGDELTFEANPLGAAWSPDGRLFVSFAKTEQAGPRFCEVDPKTGAVIKDYTAIGDIVLHNPAKCLIRRNTLFVIDRVNGLCLYAIPLSQLN
ncbi:MAG: hypothetical protein NC209_00025 [Alistipes sp.]|nr:hypothetical protein [Alistipes senegalensis]MCM1249519.1 hypothetical protein [Alistipes sp.]